jgi:hypothetical protein
VGLAEGFKSVWDKAVTFKNNVVASWAGVRLVDRELTRSRLLHKVIKIGRLEIALAVVTARFGRLELPVPDAALDGSLGHA